jgi:hypothetical protein
MLDKNMTNLLTYFAALLGQSTSTELLALACWYLWWERRQHVQGEKVQQPGRAAIYSHISLDSEFQSCTFSQTK